jgi:hypothetical protein
MTLSAGFGSGFISYATAGNYGASITFSDSGGDFTDAPSNAEVVNVSSIAVPPGSIIQTALFSNTFTTTQSLSFTTQHTPITQGGSSVTHLTALTVLGLSVSSAGVVTTVGGH